MKYRSIALVVLTIVGSCSYSPKQGEDQAKNVEKTYNMQCAICHGNDGRKGLAGAKSLPDSKLSLEERINIISNGKGQMMPYKDLLSKEQIKAIAEYTMTLK